MKLHLGNLSKDLSDAQLQELVKPFGTPESAEVARDRQNGQSKGFGFVTFANAEEAKAAIAGLDGKEVNGLALKVSEARAPKDREQRPNR
jgi:cold-inducible RNA-binding protein